MVPPAASLTDFVDRRTLQELQDSFTALTRFGIAIFDADGRQLTAPTDAATQGESNRVLEWLMAEDLHRAAGQRGAGVVAPIIVDGRQLGSISIDPQADSGLAAADHGKFRDAAGRLGLPEAQIEQLLRAGVEACGPNRAASIQFLYLMANNIARLCYQEHQLRRRVDELSALYTLSTVLAQQRDLEHILEVAAREAAQTFQARAAGIRLLDDARRELRTVSVHNLSPAYREKDPILLERSEVFQKALREGVAYVADLRDDARVIHPDDAQREGLASQLCAGMIFKGEPIGVLQLFSGQTRVFSRDEVNLLRAMAQLLATAIHNSRLEAKRLEAVRVERQLHMAVDVQKKMLPDRLPRIPGFDVAARYVPSFELGGDFYDFLELGGNLGVAVADVSGKGIAASLLMASVRASLRAFAQDLYDIDQILARVNVALCRDTRANEFATLLYGVLDPRSRRFTYANAGHEPALLLRRGRISRLEAGGMVVGVDPQQKYDKGILDLEPGDMVLFYTDGLMDAMNFQRERFGRDRVIQAFSACAGKTAQDTVNHVLWEMRRFAGLNPRTDDTTLVTLKCVG